MRIAGLDGLRALAVTGVLLYHGGVDSAPGGFLGVDLFFVISGFLITTLLLAESEHRGGGVDIVAFWGRRVRRLLPGLALVVTVTVAAFTLAALADPAALRQDALAALFYVANWHFLVGGQGYFAQLAAPSPLLHTWSLAIEEQFYLVWPLLLVLAFWLRVPRWAQAMVVAAATVASAAQMGRLDGRGVDVDRLYYGTDTRAQTILVGVLTAFLLAGRVGDAQIGRRRKAPSRRARVSTTAVGVTALGCVVAAMGLARADDDRLYRGGLLLFAVISAVLVGSVVATPSSAVTRMLDTPVVRAVGVLSYSLYLWHWPVFLFLTAGRTSLDGPALLAVRLAVTLALAAAGYRLVEAPIRGSAWRPPRLVAVPVGVAAVCAGVSLVAASVLPVTPVSATRSHIAAAGLGGSAARVGTPTTGASEAEPPRHVTRATAPTSPAPRGQLRVTIVGDSTAVTLAEGLHDVPGPHGVDFYDAATMGCGVTTAFPYRYMGEIDPYKRARCRTWEARWRRVASSQPADVVAILVGRWEVADQMLDGTWTHVGAERFDAYLRRELDKAVDAASSAGARVALLTAPYYSRGEQLDGSTWPEDDPARVDAFNRLLRSVASERPDQVQVVELGRRTSGGQHHFVSAVDGVELRYDGVHFTPAAAWWLQPWLCQQMAQAAHAPAGRVSCAS